MGQFAERWHFRVWGMTARAHTHSHLQYTFTLTIPLTHSHTHTDAQRRTRRGKLGYGGLGGGQHGQHTHSLSLSRFLALSRARTQISAQLVRLGSAEAKLCRGQVSVCSRPRTHTHPQGQRATKCKCAAQRMAAEPLELPLALFAVWSSRPSYTAAGGAPPRAVPWPALRRSTGVMA